jgi:hypothetical protein
LELLLVFVKLDEFFDELFQDEEFLPVLSHNNLAVILSKKLIDSDTTIAILFFTLSKKETASETIIDIFPLNTSVKLTLSDFTISIFPLKDSVKDGLSDTEITCPAV